MTRVFGSLACLCLCCWSASALAQQYAPVDAQSWHPDLLRHDASPVDLSFLNHKPAGLHGKLRAVADRLEFADGTPARFWGGNLAAYALFVTDAQIDVQAQRIAKLGFNLMRIHHHDSMGWVDPTVIDKSRADSRHLDLAAMDRIDYWIKALKENGVYVWLDLHVGRKFKSGDVDSEYGTIPGFAEIERADAEIKGFCYFNDPVRELMKEFNQKYLEHVNAYTQVAYKDEPAVMGLLITNENDLTHHFGNLMLADKNNPVHNAIFQARVNAFADDTGLSANQVGRTWEPGPSKIFLNDQEYQFNANLLQHLAGLGVTVPIATTNTWGNNPVFSLPALTQGGLIDAHAYGQPEALSTNPRTDYNYLNWIGAAQVAGKPLSVTEWNVPYPAIDRFTAPLYVASVAALQGWDAIMLYNYSQRSFESPSQATTWSTFPDAAITGVMPAAALLFRMGHVRQAEQTFCLQLNREQTYFTKIDPSSSAALRSLLEMHRLTVCLPNVPELSWDSATELPAGAVALTDPDRDFIPAGQDFVAADTGELRRDWVQGIQTIDTDLTQAAHGWLGGRPIELSNISITLDTAKAVLAFSSLDGLPLGTSGRVLITAVAQVAAVNNQTPFRSEPISGSLRYRGQAGLELVALGPDGSAGAALAMEYNDGTYTITLSSDLATHWLELRGEPGTIPDGGTDAGPDAGSDENPDADAGTDKLDGNTSSDANTEPSPRIVGRFGCSHHSPASSGQLLILLMAMWMFWYRSRN